MEEENDKERGGKIKEDIKRGEKYERKGGGKGGSLITYKRGFRREKISQLIQKFRCEL